MATPKKATAKQPAHPKAELAEQVHIVPRRVLSGPINPGSLSEDPPYRRTFLKKHSIGIGEVQFEHITGLGIYGGSTLVGVAVPAGAMPKVIGLFSEAKPYSPPDQRSGRSIPFSKRTLGPPGAAVRKSRRAMAFTEILDAVKHAAKYLDPETASDGGPQVVELVELLRDGSLVSLTDSCLSTLRDLMRVVSRDKIQ